MPANQKKKLNKSVSTPKTTKTAEEKLARQLGLQTLPSTELDHSGARPKRAAVRRLSHDAYKPPVTRRKSMGVHPPIPEEEAQAPASPESVNSQAPTPPVSPILAAEPPPTPVSPILAAEPPPTPAVSSRLFAPETPIYSPAGKNTAQKTPSKYPTTPLMDLSLADPYPTATPFRGLKLNAYSTTTPLTGLNLTSASSASSSSSSSSSGDDSYEDFGSPKRQFSMHDLSRSANGSPNGHARVDSDDEALLPPSQKRIERGDVLDELDEAGAVAEVESYTEGAEAIENRDRPRSPVIAVSTENVARRRSAVVDTSLEAEENVARRRSAVDDTSLEADLSVDMDLTIDDQPAEEASEPAPVQEPTPAQIVSALLERTQLAKKQVTEKKYFFELSYAVVFALKKAQISHAERVEQLKEPLQNAKNLQQGLLTAVSDTVALREELAQLPEGFIPEGQTLHQIAEIRELVGEAEACVKPAKELLARVTDFVTAEKAAKRAKKKKKTALHKRIERARKKVNIFLREGVLLGKVAHENSAVALIAQQAADYLLQANAIFQSDNPQMALHLLLAEWEKKAATFTRDIEAHLSVMHEEIIEADNALQDLSAEDATEGGEAQKLYSPEIDKCLTFEQTAKANQTKVTENLVAVEKLIVNARQIFA